MVGLVFRPWAKKCPLFERCSVLLRWIDENPCTYIDWLVCRNKRHTFFLPLVKQSFFTSLKISITTFGIRRAYIFTCLRICLTRLFLFVITGCFPNYFLHERNLFLKKNNYWEEIILILMASENNCIYMLPFVLEISCCIGTTIRVLCALHILFIMFSTWSVEGRFDQVPWMNNVNFKYNTCFKDRGRPDKSSYFEIHIAVNYAKNRCNYVWTICFDRDLTYICSQLKWLLCLHNSPLCLVWFIKKHFGIVKENKNDHSNSFLIKLVVQ